LNLCALHDTEKKNAVVVGHDAAGPVLPLAGD